VGGLDLQPSNDHTREQRHKRLLPLTWGRVGKAPAEQDSSLQRREACLMQMDVI